MIWILSAGKAFNNRSRRYEEAFTLIEMIGVIVLIGLILGLVVPFALDTLERVQSKASLQSVVAILHSARTRAIATKTPLVFQGDFEQGRYWVGDAASQEIYTSGRLAPDDRFLEFSDGGDTLHRGFFVIRFFPTGSTSGGTIHLQLGSPKDEQARRYLLTVDPVTGKARVRRET